jgi:hypothetical protein
LETAAGQWDSSRTGQQNYFVVSSLRVFSCLCLLSGGIFGACLPGLGGFNFLPVCAHACLQIALCCLPTCAPFLPLACPYLASGSFRAASWLYLIGGLPFACLPALCRLARFVPFRACVCFVARFVPLTCLYFVVWLVSCRFILVSAW